jgi:hypothetical protein
MIDIILNMTRSGNSWERMGQYYKINADTIRKRFYKWVDLDVFKLAKRAILKIYKKKKIKKQKKNKQSIEKNYYIDSTIIANHTGSLDFGYSYKIKNKKSIKITVTVDENKVPFVFMITRGNPNDAASLEQFIKKKNISHNKPCNLIGDKGYIKKQEYIEFIKNKYNINLITPDKKNAVNKKELKENEKLLRKRYVVEHFFSFLKRGFNRINSINDKKIILYENFMYIACGLITANQMKYI